MREHKSVGVGVSANLLKNLDGKKSLLYSLNSSLLLCAGAGGRQPHLRHAPVLGRPRAAVPLRRRPHRPRGLPGAAGPALPAPGGGQVRQHAVLILLSQSLKYYFSSGTCGGSLVAGMRGEAAPWSSAPRPRPRRTRGRPRPRCCGPTSWPGELGLAESCSRDRDTHR